MLSTRVKMLLLVLCISSNSGCAPEDVSDVSVAEASLISSRFEQKKEKSNSGPKTLRLPESENLRDLVLKVVVPTECGATEFSEIIGKHLIELLSNELAAENLNYYLYLQENAIRLRIGTDTFGQNGEYTKHVQKDIGRMESFWKMPGQIEVLGEHTETLNDREKLADILWYTIQDLETRDEVYPMVDEILENNRRSSILTSSPFLSADGMARANKEIIIGDGLVQMFAETGIDEKIVWTGILAHEWAHQIQFEHMEQWYPPGTFETTAEATRTKELEADFFSGYYMTHKRGATYNWKQAEQFFELFYQAGDCSFEFEQHHGTPLQRKQASYEGYLLAQTSRKKGHILSSEELHRYFMENVLTQLVQQSEYL